jgi:hypothetical protein
MTPAPQYLPKADYESLVEELLTAKRDDWDHENSIRISLGERLNVWPESIKTVTQ